MRALLIPALALGLAACASDDHDARSGDASPAATGHAAADPSADPDLAFVDGMLPHHEGALEMARLAPERAASPQVRALAEAIVRSQAAETDTLRAWRSRWFADAPATSGMGHMDRAGMDMDALRAASGADFDRLFLYGMIAHHADAVPMAADAHRRSARPEVRALAAQIVRDQAREIGQMQALLDGMAPAEPAAARATPAAGSAPGTAVGETPPAAAAVPTAAPAAAPASAAVGRTVAVEVTADGFEPARVSLPVGVPSQLVFTRTSDATCATSVVSPALGIAETALPLGQAVSVRVTPERSGDLAFACGMDMVTGVVAAQ